MAQENIGAFIQKMRRENEMTQKELADILHISDKTISKWETGKGMPDVSYMEDLCAALHISINELLSGEKLPPEEYPKKAEDNMLYLLQENHETKKQNRWSLILGGVLLVLGVAGVFSLSGLNMTWYLDVPSFLVLACIDENHGLGSFGNRFRHVTGTDYDPLWLYHCQLDLYSYCAQT